MRVAPRIAALVLLLSVVPASLLYAQDRVDLRRIFGQGVRSVLSGAGEADTTNASAVRLEPGQIVAAVQDQPISILATQVARIEALPPVRGLPMTGPPDSIAPPDALAAPPPVGGGLTDQLMAQLPKFLMLDASGETALELTPIVLAQQGLRFTGRAYQAVLYLGVSEDARPSQATPLSGPVPMQILSTVGSVAPGEIEITHTNPPYTTATLSLERAPQDSLIEITILTPSSPLGANVAIPVHPTRIVLDVVPVRIQGLGLESAEVVVQLPMEVQADSAQVTLRSDGARPDPVVLHLEGGETARATLRSARVGRATVQAVSPQLGIASTPVEVQFTFPTWFLAAALLGGLIGGLVAWLRGDRKKAIAIYLGGAILTGFLVAVLYVAGLGMLVLPAIHLEVPNVLDELFVFALAALGALIGLPKTLGGAAES